MALYNAYRIIRQGGGGDGEPSRPRYFVQRPDGSECCRDVTWGEAERAIQRDMRANRWPADNMPASFDEGNGQNQRAIKEPRRASTANSRASNAGPTPRRSRTRRTAA